MITLLVTIYVIVFLLMWLLGLIEMGADVPGIVMSFFFALVWPFFALSGIFVVVADLFSLAKGKLK